MKKWKFVFHVKAVEQSDDMLLLTLEKINHVWFPVQKDDIMEFDEADIKVEVIR